jgi:hypothetical protein
LNNGKLILPTADWNGIFVIRKYAAGKNLNIILHP